MTSENHDRRKHAVPRPRAVIVGAGFGGLAAAKRLANQPIDVTLVDQRNYHLFQPLLYQVATAALSPADIAWPIRSIFANAPNVRVVLGTVEGLDLEAREVDAGPLRLPYDYLVLATGSYHSYLFQPSLDKGWIDRKRVPGGGAGVLIGGPVGRANLRALADACLF